MFIREGNRAPVAKATHARNWEGPAVENQGLLLFVGHAACVHGSTMHTRMVCAWCMIQVAFVGSFCEGCWIQTSSSSGGTVLQTANEERQKRARDATARLGTGGCNVTSAHECEHGQKACALPLPRATARVARPSTLALSRRSLYLPNVQDRREQGRRTQGKVV